MDILDQVRDQRTGQFLAWAGPTTAKISSTRIRLTYIRKTRKSLFNSLKIVRDFRVSHNNFDILEFWFTKFFQSRSVHAIIGVLFLSQVIGVGCATLNLTEFKTNYCYFYLKVWFFSVVCIPMMGMQILYAYRVYYQLGHYARVS